MIYDRIESLENYAGVIPNVGAITAFLAKNPLSALAPGQYPIDGERLYVMVSEIETEPKEQRRWESHFRYADLQCVISGTEVFGAASVAALPDAPQVNREEDIQFFNGNPQNAAWVTMQAGKFLYFGLEDAHKPCCMQNAPQKVTKAVFKILLK